MKTFNGIIAILSFIGILLHCFLTKDTNMAIALFATLYLNIEAMKL